MYIYLKQNKLYFNIKLKSKLALCSNLEGIDYALYPEETILLLI